MVQARSARLTWDPQKYGIEIAQPSSYDSVLQTRFKHRLIVLPQVITDLLDGNDLVRRHRVTLIDI